jgi:hypothetical protein
MIRCTPILGVLCLLTAATPARLHAQFNPYQSGNNPYVNNPYGNGSNGSWTDPRYRRSLREKAVAKVGPVARDFVEAMGDDAVAAIFACPAQVGEKLARWHASGELGKLPRPRDLLRVIAQPGHGADVALWAIQHTAELMAIDNLDAYLQMPLEYALGLKSLAAGAAEARARRFSQPAPVPARQLTLPPWADEKTVTIGVVGFLVIVALLLFRRRRGPQAG